MKPVLLFLLLLPTLVFADVLPTPGPDAVFPLLIVTILIELGVFYWLYKKKATQRAYLTVLGANIISYGLASALLFDYIAWGGFEMSMWLLEIPIILFEGGVLYWFNKKAFPLKEAMKASLYMNLSTIVIGILLGILLALSYTPALPPV